MTDAATGPQVGRTVTLEIFDERGKRIRWTGRISGLERNALEIALAPGDPALSMVEGTQAMVEHEDETGTNHFLTTILEVRISRGVRVLVEAPVSAVTLKRRRFIRYAARVPVTCRFEGRERPAFFTSTRELGASGASLLGDSHAPSGALVRMEFDLGEVGLCSATAQVKHSQKVEGSRRDEHQWGVEFIEMDGKNLARLLAYLRAPKRGVKS